MLDIENMSFTIVAAFILKMYEDLKNRIVVEQH